MDQKRATNVEIAAAGRRLELEVAELLCECAKGDCTLRLLVPLDEFDEARESGLYLITDGHENGSNESVVERRERYVLVARTDS